MTTTRTINTVIDTIHTFVDCLSGIIDAWDAFSRTEIAYFTTHAPDKLQYPQLLIAITRNVAELERMRKLLITKRERFIIRVESVSFAFFRFFANRCAF